MLKREKNDHDNDNMTMINKGQVEEIHACR